MWFTKRGVLKLVMRLPLNIFFFMQSMPFLYIFNLYYIWHNLLEKNRRGNEIRTCPGKTGTICHPKNFRQIGLKASLFVLICARQPFVFVYFNVSQRHTVHCDKRRPVTHQRGTKEPFQHSSKLKASEDATCLEGLFHFAGKDFNCCTLWACARGERVVTSLFLCARVCVCCSRRIASSLSNKVCAPD